MKRCYSLLLLLFLLSGNTAPLVAQEEPARVGIEGTQKPADPYEKTTIKLTGSQLIVENLPEDGILEIYNIMGAKVFQRRVKAGTNQYILSLPKGYYIVKIGKFTRKFALK